MQVAIHLGAHCTDDDRLLKTLLRNKGVLAKEGISVPGPGRYRGTLIKSAQKLRGAEANTDTQEMLVDAIVDDDTTKRVILACEDFMCVPGRIFDNGMLYERAGDRPRWLRNLFPNDQVEFFLAIRNPATFIPASFHHKSHITPDFNTFMDETNVRGVCWSDVILAIQESNPDCRMTVWCNEDTPLIWPAIIHEITGHDENTPIKGSLAVINSIMKREGMQRMRTYLSTHVPKNEIQRRRILAAFLDKYAIEDEVEEELDLPGWTEELVAALTQAYEDDIYRIERMPGVNFISL